MNAYELADFIDKYCEDNTSKEAAVLLRQQADRIAELEKQTKPLSYNDIMETWWKTMPNAKSCEGVFEFARAIEERHGIK